MNRIIALLRRLFVGPPPLRASSSVTEKLDTTLGVARTGEPILYTLWYTEGAEPPFAVSIRHNDRVTQRTFVSLTAARAVMAEWIRQKAVRVT